MRGKYKAELKIGLSGLHILVINLTESVVMGYLSFYGVSNQMRPLKEKGRDPPSSINKLKQVIDSTVMEPSSSPSPPTDGSALN